MSTEPVITVNGVTLTQGQAMAVRVAVTSFHKETSNPVHLGEDAEGRRMTEAYHDRLTEVIHRFAPAAPQKAPPERVNRILQLAGFIPESATGEVRRLAEGYAAADLPVDEAAVRLMKSLASRPLRST